MLIDNSDVYERGEEATFEDEDEEEAEEDVAKGTSELDEEEFECIRCGLRDGILNVSGCAEESSRFV